MSRYLLRCEATITHEAPALGRDFGFGSTDEETISILIVWPHPRCVKYQARPKREELRERGILMKQEESTTPKVTLREFPVM